MSSGPKPPESIAVFRQVGYILTDLPAKEVIENLKDIAKANNLNRFDVIDMDTYKKLDVEDIVEGKYPKRILIEHWLY
jgi:hypothetical protein